MREDNHGPFFSVIRLGRDAESILAGRRYRDVLALAFLSYFSFALFLQVFPPLLPMIQGEFHVGHETASLVMTMFLALVVLGALPAGSLTDRYGVRKTEALGFLLMVIGGAFSMIMSSFPGVILGRMVGGIGASSILISTVKSLTESFPKRRHGMAFGLFRAGLPAGTGVAFDLLAPLNRWLGWRGEIVWQH